MSSATYPLKIVGRSLRTVVPVMIINPDGHKVLKTYALVDTGADACAFPENIATNTGHNLKGVGVISNVSSGIGGVSVPTWKHTFTIGLLDPTAKKVLKWSAPKVLVDCFEHNNCPPLLGSSDFLKNFKITIDYPNKRMTLEW